MNAPGFLVFSGANDRAVLALCRAFSAYGVPFGLLARGPGDLLRKSAFADRFLVQRTSSALTLSDVLAAARVGNARHGERPWVACATSEFLNLRLFDFKDALAEAGVSIATCDAGLYARLTHKENFRTYCARLGLSPPPLMDAGDAMEAPLPFVAKPRSNLSSSGAVLYPFLIRTERDRKRFLAEAIPDEFYLERFVNGESWYLLFYFSADGSFATGAQRNFLQQGHGKSIVVARSQPYPEQDLPIRIAEGLSADHYRGFIMIELKRSVDGTAVAIEANPRCWGPLQLTLDAGMGLVEAFLRDHGHKAQAPLPRQGICYGWIGGVVSAIRSGQGLDRHASRFSVATCALRAAFNDVYARKGSWSCFLSDICA